jgi:replicative DNA helicase
LAFAYLKRAWDSKVSIDDEIFQREFMTDHGEVLLEAKPIHYSVATQEVKAAATRRGAYLKVLQLQDNLRQPEVSLGKCADATIEVMDYLNSRNAQGDGVRSIEAITASSVDLVEAAAKGDHVTIPFGLEALDKWELLRPGTMNLIAGRPGSGKTALMCTCLNAQGALGLKPACYCAEMTEEEIHWRMVSQLSQIPFGTIMAGLRDITEGQKAAYMQAVDTIVSHKPFLTGGRRMTIREFERFATQAVQEHGAKVVWLDYVQKLVPISSKTDVRNHIMECSGRIKELSQKLKVPIIPLAQFNREAEDCTPRVSHLKEAGSLEEDADGIILLDRPYARPDPAPRKYTIRRAERLYPDTIQLEMEQLKDKLVLIIGKNRNGRCGLSYSDFNGPLMSVEKAQWAWSN